MHFDSQFERIKNAERRFPSAPIQNRFGIEFAEEEGLRKGPIDMAMNIKRITITGGAGFIGTHLAERLCNEAEVVLFDNFRRDSLSALPQLANHPDVKVVCGDVLEPASVRAAFEGSDTVVHMAAIAGVSSYYNEPLQTLKVNILGTANVLEQTVKVGVKNFVQFSTSEVFGPNALWVDEGSSYQIGPVTERRWTYASSKMAGEQFTLRYGEQHGMKCSIVRPFNIYGPRQTGEGAVSNFCRAIVERKPLSDLVDAVMSILVTPEAAGQAFNIGNPREVETTLGLARRIAQLQHGAKIETQAIDRAEVRVRIPNIERARQILKFEPKVSLYQGLRETLAWFQKESNRSLCVNVAS